MRVARADELSGIDSVELGDQPDPAPAAGEALIRVYGAGVGPWDVGFLSGGFPGIALPFVPGQEVAGVVGLLQAGEAVLITAAAGGVGSAAVQIEAAMGARPIAVASPANHEYLRGLGASEVFDYHVADWAEQVLGVVPGGVDLLLDCAGGQIMGLAVGAVRDGGRAISVIPPFGPLQLERGVTGESFAAHGGRQRLEALSRMVDSGQLRPQVEAVLPLSEVREALRRVTGRHTRGKIVLQIGQ